MLEVVDHFGAASYETQKVEGHWRHGGIIHRDDLVRIVVDVPDTPANRQWMRLFKSRWKARLDQLELWQVSYRIDIESFGCCPPLLLASPFTLLTCRKVPDPGSMVIAPGDTQYPRSITRFVSILSQH